MKIQSKKQVIMLILGLFLMFFNSCSENKENPEIIDNKCSKNEDCDTNKLCSIAQKCIDNPCISHICQEFATCSVENDLSKCICDENYYENNGLCLSNTTRPITLHYYKSSNNYNNWGVHLWISDNEGYDTSITQWDTPIVFDKTDEWGAYTTIDIPNLDNNKTLWMKIHDNKDNIETTFNFYNLNELKEFWVMENDTTLYNKKPEKLAKIQSAELISGTEIQISLFDTSNIDKTAVVLMDNDDKVINIDSIDGNIIKTSILESNKSYKLLFNEQVTYIKVLNVELVDDYCTTNDSLGVEFNENTVNFKFWTPIADMVRVYIFDKTKQYQFISSKNMVKRAGCLWELELSADEIEGLGDLDQYFYQYDIVSNNKSTRVLDPYGKSLAAFNQSDKDKVGKAAIIKTSSMGVVESYADIDNYNKRSDAIIYEVHIRDFTSDPNLTTENRFGTYKAFIEKLDYIKKLGVTHIQLLPVQSIYWINEFTASQRELEDSVLGNNYDWGYATHNFFSPEGSYSSNINNPYQRILDLKELINAIHERKMGVILDVVYNHTAKTEIFDAIMAKYFYRLDENGNYTNVSCCNDFATTRKMASKLIIDSIEYWTREYKVDGYRFDLMALIDRETLEKAYDKASALNGKILFIGEPWPDYNGYTGNGGDKEWMKLTNSASVFSDDFRNMLKRNDDGKGFLTGENRNVWDIEKIIKGNTIGDQPGDVVNYVAAHDGLTLHDTVVTQMSLNPITDKEEIYKRIKLANLFVLTSQGIAFLHAGQEMARSKKMNNTPTNEEKEKMIGDYVRDSFDSSDSINKIDWSKTQDPDIKNLIDYTTGLIKLRRSTDAFSLGDKNLVDSSVKLSYCDSVETSGQAIVYETKATNGDKYFIFVNATNSTKDFETTHIDLSNTIVIVDSDEAGVTEVSELSGVNIYVNKVTLEGLTAVVFKKKN